MKKPLCFFYYLLFSLLFINFSLKAQIFSEAPLSFSETGDRLSTFIYFKIRSGGFLSSNINDENRNSFKISSRYSDIDETIQRFCNERKINLDEIKIKKAISNAEEKDTLFIDKYSGEKRILPNLARVFIIQFPKPIEIEILIDKLKNHYEVEYAHGPVQLVNCAVYPNDQYYVNGGQWYLDRIDAPNAWGITKGDPNIKIALIETEGVELTHSDLSSKIAGGDNNPGGVVGIHGTRVAGFAGAATNNGNLGIASLGWNIKLLTFQPHNDDEYRNILAQKIKDAADSGATVINMSFKTIEKGHLICPSELKKNSVQNLAKEYYINKNYGLVADAIDYAAGMNSIIVASAGNNAEIYTFTNPCELVPYSCYPAQYDNVIAVSGSYENNDFVDGWNYGSFVDLNAPGGTNSTTGLWTTNLNNGYTTASGTSFSAPQVSALIALIKSINNSLSLSQVKSILENSADKVGQYSYSNNRNDYFGYGRINAYKALKYTIENFGGSFNQDITIPASDTLNIQPGKSLSFNSDCKLIVNGTLNAIGNSTNGITFNRSGSTGTWGGIQFNYQSTGSLDYCTITNASTGIYCYNSSPTIKHSTLDNNSTGLSCSYYSSPNLVGNNFRYNYYYGISCYTYCSPNLTDNGYPGSNVIRNNQIGIYAYYSSNPSLYGYMTYGNSVFNNSTRNIYAIDGCTVNAQRVFWNGSPNNYADNSTIDASNPLTTNPNPNRSLIEKSEPMQILSKMESINTDQIQDELAEALNKQREKRYDEAITLFLEVFKKNKNDLVGKYALTKIEECFTQSERKDYLTFSEKEIKPNIEIGSETYVIALELEAHQMVNAGEYSEAIINITTILTKYNLNEDIEKNTLFTLGSFYTLFTENKGDADNYFNTLKTKYPADDLTSQIKIIKGMGNSLAGDKKIILPNPDIKSESINNNEEISISNYPNPFNPTTTIEYTLPTEGNVKLEVYNSIGQLVNILVEGYQNAGRQKVSWSGKDSFGCSVTSGIYFYRLITSDFSQVRKMILMK